MSGFSEDWLSLRESADTRARSALLATHFLQAVPRDDNNRNLVVDLAGGSGNNAVYLTELMPGAFDWRMVDSDPNLLSAAAARLAGADCRLTDLSDPGELFSSLEGASAVACSALLDLVSYDWLFALCRQAAAEGMPILAALSYSGIAEICPAHDYDDVVLRAFNQHQGGDKGFGPALGPKAAAEFADILSSLDYETRSADSDWRLDAPDAVLIGAVLEGVYSAAIEIEGPADAASVETWYRDRLARLGETRLTVSHVDVLGLPPGAQGNRMS